MGSRVRKGESLHPCLGCWDVTVSFHSGSQNAGRALFDFRRPESRSDRDDADVSGAVKVSEGWRRRGSTDGRLN